MIQGASGALGVMVLQYLKALDCNVTAVCRGANDALVRSPGADAVVDYTTCGYGDVDIDRCGLRTQSRVLNRLGGTLIGCGLNGSMQHLHSHYRDGGDTNEVSNENILHRS